MPAPLVFMSGDPVYVAATKGTPLDCLALVARVSSSPGPRTIRLKEIVLRKLPLPGY